MFIKPTTAAAAAIVLLFAAPSWAAKAAPNKSATVPTPQDKPVWMLGGRTDSFGISPVLGRAAGKFSWNVFISTGKELELLNNNLSDPVKIREYGAQARWHWAGHAPTGWYGFFELANMQAEFEKSASAAGRTSSSLDTGLTPALGAGYCGGRKVTWDIGFGLRKTLEYSATYNNGGSGGAQGRSSQSMGGLVYFGLGFRL